MPTRKKAILRKLSRDWVAGYVAPEGFLENGRLELLDLSGRVLAVPPSELKWVCFVRDFNSGETNNPERLLRKTFAGRPRTEGLWMRLRLTDGDLIEGVAANGLTLIASEGLFLMPPDTRGNTQRLWVPHSAVTGLEIVAVIGARKSPEIITTQETTSSQTQEQLFPS